MYTFQQYMVEYKHLLGEGMSWSLIDSFIDSSVFFRIFLKIEQRKRIKISLTAFSFLIFI